MVAVEPLAANTTGAAQQKLPRRQSILNSLRKGLRRNHDLPEVTAISIPDKQEGGPPLLRRRSSNPELRPKVSRRAIASLPRQQTLKRSESEKRGKLLEVPSGDFEKRQAGDAQKRGWSVGGLRRQRSPRPGPIPSASAPEVSAHGSNEPYGTIDTKLSQNDNTQQSGSAPSDMSSHGYFDRRHESTSSTLR